MKLSCVVILFFGFVAYVAGEPAEYIPKSFYKLDSNGAKSHVVQINPHQANILRRLRRSPQNIFSSSSSSSSASDDNGQTYFTQQSTVQQSPSLQSRFGESQPVYGQTIQTSGVVDNDGRIYYNTQRGLFKK